MLDQLYCLIAKRVSLQKKNLKTLDDLSEKIVFNCTGLGYKKLISDDSLMPILGHLVMLKNQTPSKIQYMLIVNFQSESTPELGVERTLDFFPKHIPSSPKNDIGVLDGTFTNSSNMDISHEVEFQKIINRAKFFFYGGSTHE